MRGQDFFFDAADGENQTRESNLAGHRSVRSHAPAGIKRSQRRRDRYARAGAVLRNRAGRNVQVHTVTLEHFGSDTKLFSVRPQIRTRGPRRFLHDLAELSGDGQTAAAGQQPNTYKPGDQVEALLLAERTKKGGWKATITGSMLTGPVQGTAPANAEAGKTVRLVIAAFTAPQTVSFWWPDSAPKAKKR